MKTQRPQHTDISIKCYWFSVVIPWFSSKYCTIYDSLCVPKYGAFEMNKRILITLSLSLSVKIKITYTNQSSSKRSHQIVRFRMAKRNLHKTTNPPYRNNISRGMGTENWELAQMFNFLKNQMMFQYVYRFFDFQYVLIDLNYKTIWYTFASKRNSIGKFNGHTLFTMRTVELSRTLNHNIRAVNAATNSAVGI